MKLRNLLTVVFVALSVISCEDAYRVDPADEIIDLNAIRSIEDLERAMTGVYAGVGGQSFVEWSSMFTDECRKPSSNRGSGVQVHTWSINNGTNEPDGYYAGLYGTINRVNVVLARMDNVVAVSQADIDAKERIAAELLTIRAMAHFDLLRFFATDYSDPTALATPIVNGEIVFETLPRNTVGEVIDFVLGDLETAHQSLVTVGSNSDVTRVTPLAIQALRARISLYIKDYSSAVTYAQEVVNAIPLAANPTQYLDIWDDANTAEIVFKLKRVQGNGQIGRIYKDADGTVLYNISNDLWAQFTNTDLRRAVGALVETGSTLADLRVGKYSGPSSNYGLADVKLFRVAEMYLILSEAHALKATPDFAAAEAAINTLRASRRLAPTALPNLTFTSGADAIDKILLERRRELAFEGHRFFDLKRFGRGVDRIASDVVLNSFAEDLPAGDYRFTLPIPQGAIFANSLLVQNPGY